MEKYIIKLKNKVLREKEISYEEALNLISLDTNNKNDFDILLKSANVVKTVNFVLSLLIIKLV